MTVAGVMAYVGLALFFIFNLKSAIVYWTWTREAAEKDLLDGPLLTPWGMHPSVVKGWIALIGSYFDPNNKQATMRTHMAVAMVITTLLTINLIPMVRKKWMVVHRWSGRICVAFALMNAPSFWHLVLNFKASKSTQYIELSVVFMIVFFGAKGWLSARSKDIQSHRSSMIMFSCCFFYFGVQRICLLLVQALHSIPAFYKSLPLGDITKVTGPDYWEVLFGAASFFAAILTFGIGAYNAYGPRIKSKTA